MKVLFIDIDTLRPDHMGCYGYHRNTTPYMDKVAAEGLRFDNYYCSDAPCLPSRAALTTGRFGIHNGAVGHGGTAADKRYQGASRHFRDEQDENNLFQVFRKAGMHTVSISTFAERHSSWWFNAGFNEMYNVGKGGVESGEEVIPIALDWLERNQEREDWMMHLHLWDPHTPYRVPESFGNPFAKEPMPHWITDEVFAQHLNHTGPHSLHEINMYDDHESSYFPRQPGKALDKEALKRVFDGYDCGIRYADELLGKVFERLKGMGIYDQVAIVITSDHGENMGELGIYSEHATADCPTCRIPMIIKWPGAPKGRVDDAFHYQLDLCPTMAQLFHVTPYAKWDGLSYATTILGGDDVGHEYLVLSQQAHVCQRSVRFDKWLYMRTYHDGYHLFPDEMLFNIEEDPYEEHNLAADKPHICHQGAALLLKWHDKMMHTGESPVDPMWTVLKEGGPEHTRGYLKDYLIRLEETGREDGANRLRSKYKDILI